MDPLAFPPALPNSPPPRPRKRYRNDSLTPDGWAEVLTHCGCLAHDSLALAYENIPPRGGHNIPQQSLTLTLCDDVGAETFEESLVRTFSDPELCAQVLVLCGDSNATVPLDAPALGKIPLGRFREITSLLNVPVSCGTGPVPVGWPERRLLLNTLRVADGDPARLGLMYPELTLRNHRGPLATAPLTHLRELSLVTCLDPVELRLAGLPRLHTLRLTQVGAQSVSVQDLPALATLYVRSATITLLDNCPSLARVDLSSKARIVKAHLVRPLDHLEVSSSSVHADLPARRRSMWSSILLVVSGLGTMPALEELVLGGLNLLCMAPQPDLRVLQLCAVQIPKLPPLPSLEECTISQSHPNPCPLFADMPRLRKLVLCGCDLPESLDLAAFPALRDLRITGAKSLSVFPAQPMPRGLERLEIDSCHRLKRLHPLLGVALVRITSCMNYDPVLDDFFAKLPDARDVVLQLDTFQEDGKPILVAGPTLRRLSVLNTARCVLVPALPNLAALRVTTAHLRLADVMVAVAPQPNLSSVEIGHHSWCYNARAPRSFPCMTSGVRRCVRLVPGPFPGLVFPTKASQ